MKFEACGICGISSSRDSFSDGRAKRSFNQSTEGTPRGAVYHGPAWHISVANHHMPSNIRGENIFCILKGVNP